MKNIQELKEKLLNSKKVIITTHHKPDGDAIGSSLGLYHFLKNNYRHLKVVVVTPNDYAHFLQWLPGNDLVIDFEQKPEMTKQLVADADLIFCLDFNKLHRINKLGKEVGSSKAEKVLIDHHIEPDDFAKYKLSVVTASSTAELIYDFIKLLDANNKLSKDIATCLYVGIMTDTGSFRFDSVTPKVHEITADILRYNIAHDEIYNRVYNTFTENRLHFFGYCMQECLEYFPEYHTTLIAVDREALERYEISTGDTEGLVNYALAIEGTRFGALIVDRIVTIKMSFRSTCDFDVHEFAKKYFNGGGHQKAAGGNANTSLETEVRKFKELLPRVKDQIV